MRIRPLARLLLLAVLSAGGAAAILSAQQSGPPAFKSGVELVTVDLTVLNRSGVPIVDLAVPDVTVTVDGRPRPIVSLRLVRADVRELAAPRSDTPAPAPRPAPTAGSPDPGRRFILVVDRDHIARGEGQQMLSAAARFLDRMTPDDRAAVWAIPATSSRLAFSSDRAALARQLRSMVGTQPPPFGKWMIARDEALQIEDGLRQVLADVVSRECNRQPPGCPVEVEMQAKGLARDTRDRATIAMTDLEGLIDALGKFDGPKHLIWITGGPPLLREFRTGLIDLGARAAAARVTVHALQVFEPSYQARTDAMRATPDEVDQTQSIAYALAGTTGGLAITPASGEVAFGQLSKELSASYLLAFEAEAADRDGKPHAIAVRVADRGWGVSVRARTSFRIDASAAVAGPAVPGMAQDLPAAPEAAPEPAPLGTDVAALLGRLGDDVEAFERGFSAVVAEERYVQVVHPWRGNPKGPEAEPSLAWSYGEPGASARKGGPIVSRRTLLSDVLLVQTTGARWVGYRDVAEVDGKAIRDRTERVRDLFLSGSPERDAQFQRIVAESARYNLGDFGRTLNIPTAALSFMRGSEQWRFEFRRAADETIGGRASRVLSYREKARPTLVGTRGGSDIPIDGRIWLDAETGRVLRTEIRFDRGSEKRSLIRVDFGPVPGADVLAPVLMWEWYEGATQLGRMPIDRTLVQCLATYSNFRRFQVATAQQVK